MRRLLVILAVVAASCSLSEPEVLQTTITAPPDPVAPSTVTTAAPPSVTPTATTAPPPATAATTTTTMPATTTTAGPDLQPPSLALIAPPSGSVVAEDVVTFRGTTEAGAIVSAWGRFPAEVDDGGNWSISLTLTEGPNLARFVARDAAGNETVLDAVVTMEPPLPVLYRFDGSGLYERDAGTETLLVSGAIDEVRDDLSGGVLYWPDPESPGFGTHHLRADGTDVVLPHPALSAQLVVPFTAVHDGAPTLFFAEMLEPVGYDSPLAAVDLDSGEVIPSLIGNAEGRHKFSDSGWAVSSFGGDRFVAVWWTADGPAGTDHSIGFFDAAGNPIEFAANPIAVSCAPCEIEALIAPSGGSLATLTRPDAFHEDSPHWDEDFEVWRAASAETRSTLRIIDLGTGAVDAVLLLPAFVTLADYDGKHVVTYDASTGRSTVWNPDTGAARAVLDGEVRLSRPPA